jgi:hypothetical protein
MEFVSKRESCLKTEYTAERFELGGGFNAYHPHSAERSICDEGHIICQSNLTPQFLTA